MKSLLVLAVALVLTSCGFMVDEETAYRVLKQNGYTEVQTTGYRYLGCSRGENLHTGFVAKSPAGVVVSGVVCTTIVTRISSIKFD